MASSDTAAPDGERQKRDDYYAGLPEMRTDDAMRAFGEGITSKAIEQK